MLYILSSKKLERSIDPYAAQKQSAPLFVRGARCEIVNLLLRHDTAGPSFFSLGLLGGHGLVHPVVGVLEISLAGIGIVALQVGFFAVQQVQVGHRVVVIRTQLQCLLQPLDSILHSRLVLILDGLDERGAVFLVLKVVGRLQAKLGALVHTTLVGLGPINHRDGVVGFRIVGIQIGDLLVVLLGQIELLHVEVQRSNTFQAVDLLLGGGMQVQNLLEYIDGLLRKAIVFR